MARSPGLGPGHLRGFESRLLDQLSDHNEVPTRFGTAHTRHFNSVGQTCGCSSVVEHLLPKQDVVGSIPITRSIRACGTAVSALA